MIDLWLYSENVGLSVENEYIQILINTVIDDPATYVTYTIIDNFLADRFRNLEFEHNNIFEGLISLDIAKHYNRLLSYQVYSNSITIDNKYKFDKMYLYANNRFTFIDILIKIFLLDLIEELEK